MADCPYCLETGNSFNVTKLDPGIQVEVEVVACKEPYWRFVIIQTMDGLQIGASV